MFLSRIDRYPLEEDLELTIEALTLDISKMYQTLAVAWKLCCDIMNLFMTTFSNNPLTNARFFNITEMNYLNFKCYDELWVS